MKKFTETYLQVDEGLLRDFFNWLFGIGKKKTEYTTDSPYKYHGSNFYPFDTNKFNPKTNGGKLPNLILTRLDSKKINDDAIYKICNGESTSIKDKKGLYNFLQYYNANKGAFAKYSLDIVADKDTLFTYAIIVYGIGLTLQLLQLLQSANTTQAPKQALPTQAPLQQAQESIQESELLAEKFIGILLMDYYHDDNIDVDMVGKQTFKLITTSSYLKELLKNGYEGIKINYSMLKEVGLDKYLPKLFDETEMQQGTNVEMRSWSFDDSHPIALTTEEPNAKPTAEPTQAPTELPNNLEQLNGEEQELGNGQEQGELQQALPTQEPTLQPLQLNDKQVKLSTTINNFIKAKKEIAKIKAEIAKLPKGSVSPKIKNSKWFTDNGIQDLNNPIFEANLQDKRKQNSNNYADLQAAKKKALQDFENSINNLLKELNGMSDEDIKAVCSLIEGLDKIVDIKSLKDTFKIGNIKVENATVADDSESELSLELEETDNKENGHNESENDNEKKDDNDEPPSIDPKDWLVTNIRLIMFIKAFAQLLIKICEKTDDKESLLFKSKDSIFEIDLTKYGLSSFYDDFFKCKCNTDSYEQLYDYDEIKEIAKNWTKEEDIKSAIDDICNLLQKDCWLNDNDVKEVCSNFENTIKVSACEVDTSFLKDVDSIDSLKKALGITKEMEGIHNIDKGNDDEENQLIIDKQEKKSKSFLTSIKSMVKSLFSKNEKSEKDKDNKEQELKQEHRMISLHDYILESLERL